ncbi:MAG: hypothetical protein ACO2PN_08350 [Pyrobaculum sp.]|jgi:hypothetical protein
MAQTQTSQKTAKIRVKYYIGANAILTFYIPTEGGVAKEKVYEEGQTWASKVVEHVKTHGRERFVKRYYRGKYYSNPVYEAEIDVSTLAGLIKTTPTWTRSKHARNLIKFLE